MWEESSTSRSLFSRARERHVFLFEKMVIFSKKIEAAAVQKREKKSDNYLYKGHLQVGACALSLRCNCVLMDRSIHLHFVARFEM